MGRQSKRNCVYEPVTDSVCRQGNGNVTKGGSAAWGPPELLHWMMRTSALRVLKGGTWRRRKRL